ncbi:MAG: VanZ family protein [Phycisphaeraceae bacterium]|nr:VanZ family protein [Phycisphaeraceae bacterium]MCW5753220.1 VanZ family protein [Phycisphaeraceae bacterium]
MRRCSRRLLIGAFVVYACLLAMLTHWPGMVVEGPVPRSDLLAHIGAFAVWGALLSLSGLPGRVGTRRNLLMTLGIGTAYAALDEWSQQFFGRVSALDDFFADVVGIVCGAMTAHVVGRVLNARPEGRKPRPGSDAQSTTGTPE